jgi:uncharacterized protein
MIDLINQIPIADTHEHLVEETDRLNESQPLFPNDISLLFIQYVESDLIVSGMPVSDFEKIKTLNGDPEEKWQLIRPWWPMIRSTGYGQMILNTIKILYHFDDLDDSNWLKINDRLSSLPKKGFYRNILKGKCNLDHCQINALDLPLFRETNFPDIFLMDLCVSTLCSDFEPDLINKIIGREIKNLDDCTEAIDVSFVKYGSKAVAIKNQSAYRRKLDFEKANRTEASNCLHNCLKKNWKVTKSERKYLEDFLFNYTVEKSVEFNLPYKLHTGYHSGHGTMPLHNLRHNAGDIAQLCQNHPRANFVFFHINYPYQDELIALAKHYPNAYIDMCWSWMINPLAAVRFLKEYLVSAPVNKLFIFGGDVSIIELVPGHLELAKKGIAQAISELVSEGWLRSEQVEHIYRCILLNNARELFQTDKKLGR